MTTTAQRPTHEIRNNGVHNYVEHGQLVAFQTGPNRGSGHWCCVERTTCRYLGIGDTAFDALAAGGKKLKSERYPTRHDIRRAPEDSHV